MGATRTTTARRRAGAAVATAVATTLLVAGGCGAPRPDGPAPTPTRPVRYMPVGDSITDGYNIKGGYRTELWQLLVQRDGDDLDFVGSRSSGPPELGDKDNEGHGGWCIDGTCNGKGGGDTVMPAIEGWLREYKPDIVSLHLGTNDMKKDADGAETARRLDALIGRIYATEPDVDLVVCQIVQARADVAKHEVYTAAIPAIADRYRAQGRSIRVVDMSELLDVPDDYVDGTHPTQDGYTKMARALYPAISDDYREVAGRV